MAARTCEDAELIIGIAASAATYLHGRRHRDLGVSGELQFFCRGIACACRGASVSGRIADVMRERSTAGVGAVIGAWLCYPTTKSPTVELKWLRAGTKLGRVSVRSAIRTAWRTPCRVI
jgi:hypothetical protein